jgi:hypothetical protein
LATAYGAISVVRTTAAVFWNAAAQSRSFPRISNMSEQMLPEKDGLFSALVDGYYYRHNPPLKVGHKVRATELGPELHVFNIEHDPLAGTEFCTVLPFGDDGSVRHYRMTTAVLRRA